MVESLIGQRLGAEKQYEIVGLLGEGGMASVYRARQLNVQREVAIKIIHANLAEAPDFIKRFEREAQTIASLSHPNILKLFDYGEHGDTVFLVMELLSGGGLDSLIRREGPLPADKAARLLDQIASALDYAHTHGIVHRDLKPQNVLLDEDGNAFLTDFGIAKLVSENTGLTQTGAVMGTPSYMAPEQWRSEVVDARTDIYALGIILYEMLTRTLPFKSDTPYGMMFLHINEAPPTLSTTRGNLPAGVNAVITKAMAKKPDQRFASAGAMAAAYRAALAGEIIPDIPSTSTIIPPSKTQQATPTVPTASKTRSPLPFIIGGIIAVVFLIGIIGIIGSQNNQGSAPTGTAISVLASITQPATPSPTMIPTRSSTPTIEPTIDVNATLKVLSQQTDTAIAQETIVEVQRQGTLSAILGATDTAIASASVTKTPTITQTPSLTLTATLTPSMTVTLTVSLTPSSTNTAVQTASATLVPTQQITPTSINAGLSGRIAFTSSRDGNKEIYVMNPDGSGLHNLTKNPADDYYPAWSPDGKLIAFISKRDGRDTPYLMEADGSHPRPIVAAPQDVNEITSIAWSPDGKLLAFDGARSPNLSYLVTDIYVVAPDGSSLKRITTLPKNNFATQPAWSPNSQQIAFNLLILNVTSQIPTSTQEIDVISADGSHQHKVVTGQVVNGVTWTPAGNQLLFPRSNTLSLATLDTLKVTALLSGNYTLFKRPGYSPNGKEIVFEADGDIYSAHADGSFPTQITHDSTMLSTDVNEDPAWSR